MSDVRTALAALADSAVGPVAAGSLVPSIEAVLATPAMAAIATVAAGVAVTGAAGMGTAIAAGATMAKGDEEEPAAPPSSVARYAGTDAATLLGHRRHALTR